MRKRRAVLFVLVPVIFFFFLSFWAMDWPLFPRVSNDTQKRKVVLVLRDDLGASLKWASHAFTIPALERHYGAIHYFTQSYQGDQLEAFQRALDEALNQYEEVDLFFLCARDSHLDWVSWADKKRTERIRFIYNAASDGASEGEEWLALGADAYVSHVGRCFSPPFYFYFLRRWSSGMTLEEALSGANARTRRYFKRLRLLSLATWDTVPMAEASQGKLFGKGDVSVGG